jgi:hypothetical protein
VFGEGDPADQATVAALVTGSVAVDIAECGARVGQHEGVDGRGDVVAADAHGGPEQGGRAQGRVGGPQLPHRRGLSDRHVVECAERSDDEPGHHQARPVDLPTERRGVRTGKFSRRGRATAERVGWWDPPAPLWTQDGGRQR